jgi:lon-related putative ATP-dependent protease
MPDTSEQTQRLSVPVGSLRRNCESLTIEAGPTDRVFPAANFLGQQRAVESLRFGLRVERDGYNIFVLGPLGSHRHTLVGELAAERANEKDAPDDWCYVNNFQNPERPRALRLPSGKGAGFCAEMRALIGEIRLAIPAAFEGDDYRNQRKELEAGSQREIEEHWGSLKKAAAKEGIGVLQTPTGYVLAPLKDGKVIDDKDFESLPREERKKIEAAIQRLSEELQARIELMPKLRKRYHERIRKLDQEVTAHAVSVLLEEIKNRYQDLPDVLSYLDAVQQNIIENAGQFRETETPALVFPGHDSSRLFESYEVNLLVSNVTQTSAPIVYEPNPSYPNLIGKVEHRAEMGALLTDFRMVRGGALLQANGGYLILDVHRVLGRPFVWEALKQALFARKVRIESPAETLGFVSTTSLQPEPIPLDVKIILIGERWLYYLLSIYDKEFNGLFKVAADFDDDLQRSTDNEQAFGKLVTHRIRTHRLLPISTAAVERVIEERARRADDSERLSTHIRSLDDLLVQADYWARQREASRIAVEDIIEALRRREYRFSRVQERVVDAIERNTLLIDTSGECVGQVNGLSVLDLSGHRFGHPVRITATTRIGTGEVVDIEREVELGGAIHSKGVMILSAALSARYAPDTPLSLQGSVVFEQSYGGVEGDSASVAEMCALLSSISGVPIRQNIACTGSVNQLGRVQAVGGVNEKIEGFFEICEKRGLDGSHGVVIPQDNVKHLMLKEEIVEAVRDKRFTVYAIEHVDDAITILTGEEAGQRDASGEFPSGTVNRKVEDRLAEYARKRRQFSETPGSDEQDT